MSQQTRIEKDAEQLGNHGWGDARDPMHHRLFKERQYAEIAEDAGCFALLPDMLAARDTENPIVEKIREQMPYDAGWDCDFVDRLLYRHVPYVNQNPIGSCVGAGASSAIASRVSSEILLEGDAENPFGLAVHENGSNSRLPGCAIPVVDYHYGCGKMQRYWDKDNQRFTRSVRLGDGSYCSAQIWALRTCGILPADKLKTPGNVPQTQSIRSNAGNGGNFLNDHVEIGLEHRMQNSVRCRSAEDLWKVINDLKQPAMICSSWGFAPDYHVDGLGWIYKRRGTWAHNMTQAAAVEFKRNRYFKVRNQWGKGAHRDGWHFWLTWDVADAWLRQAECQSIGELNLLPLESPGEFAF